jgi:capsular polysaccharide biosynthesis protein
MEWNKERIQGLLEAKTEAVTRACVAIYNLQTSDEAAGHYTRQRNNVGFSQYDAGFCTDMAKKILRGDSLSVKQVYSLRKRMMRYHRQLVEIANAKQSQAQAIEPTIEQALTPAQVDEHMKHEFALREREQERRAFMSDPDIKGTW